MKKHRLWKYGIVILLGCVSFLIWSTTFWISKPTGTTHCHNKNNNPINRSTYPEWHRYTCQLDWDNLLWYCWEKSKSFNSEKNKDWCPRWFYCHICECQSWSKTDIEWQCCKEWNTDKNWKCCWLWEVPGEDLECIKDPLLITTDNQTNPSNWEINWNDELKCFKDSKWECCKKIYYDLKTKKDECCEWILLSTNVPFIGQCIVYKKKSDTSRPVAWLVVDEDSAFPILMWWLSKILVSIILLVSFMGILVGGIMISASGGSDDGSKNWKKLIGNVISALALLGASGVILHLINPNFFW